MKNIRTLIREFVQESDLLEDYPASFDMEVFKSLKSHAGRNRYAQEHLQRLSSGSSRIVYKIDDEKVLKLAKNDKGVAQNEVEIEYGQYGDLSGILAKIFDYDEQNHLWVEMELAKKVNASDFKNLVGYKFTDIQTAIHNYGIDSGNGRGRKQEMDSELLDSMWENEFMYEIFDYIGNYGVPPGDLMRLSSYGLVKRDGKHQIVIIDYGLTHDVYSSYYS
jgi:mRNA-degrading endonuclease RelE of RelBE toxin-antitoxin system